MEVDTELQRECCILLFAHHICLRSVSFPLQLSDIWFGHARPILRLHFVVFDDSVESVCSLAIVVYLWIWSITRFYNYSVQTSLEYVVYMEADIELHRECPVCYYPLQLRDIWFGHKRPMFRLHFVVFDDSVESVCSLAFVVYLSPLDHTPSL